jgi:succinate dehydrogenase/fumarate reductase flavoprotein subunit
MKDMQDMKAVSTSRRDFLRGAALVSAGVVGASLAGCSPSDGGGDGSTGTGSGNTGAANVSGRVAGYCGPGDWLGSPPEIAENDIVETIESDLVLLGSGHAGIGAVFSAVDEGLSVSVIERQPWSAFIDLEGTGENKGGWYGEDIGHVNSKFLIRRGFGPYNTGEVTAEYCKRAAGRCNPDIIRVFVQNSGAMFDRYEEIYNSYEAERKANDSDVFLTGVMMGEGGEDGNYDMSEMFEYPFCNTQRCAENLTYPTEGGGYKSWPCNAQFYGWQLNNIEYIHKYIVQHAQEHGATYYFEHTGVVLTTDSSGAVTGLIAQDESGKYKKFTARKAVLLAAGDFIGNPDMCWALLNEGMEWAERTGASKDDWTTTGLRDGSGHKMACWVGGMIEPSPRGWMALGGGASGPWGTAPLLQLTKAGERFMNEAAVMQVQSANVRQPIAVGCWVSDANWKKTIGRAPLDHGAPNYGEEGWWDITVADMAALVPGPEPGPVRDGGMGSLTRPSDVYCANTLDELAGYLGYEGDNKTTFLASIAHYNELCNSADGDTDYGKDKQFMVAVNTPPFYGGAGGGGPMGGGDPHSMTPMMVTLSGLITDKYQNVLNKDWEPIKGLYACGNCLGGRYGLGYSTPFAGNSVGMAITHGYTASKIIAKL